MGALFANPAGLSAFKGTTFSASLGLGFGSMKLDNDQGFHQSNDLLMLIPDFAVAVAGHGRWHYGLATYGSVGASYDFEAVPTSGMPEDVLAEDVLAETMLLALPMAVAYRVNDRLSVGAELIAMFGHLRNRYTAGDQRLRYTLRGPGLQAMLGVTWQATPDWSWGLAVHTPGRIWMDGSAAFSDGNRRDIDLEIQMPMKIALGVTHRPTSKIALFASSSWIDSSRFSESQVRFENMAVFNTPFVPAAKDEWRSALGVEIAATTDWTLRFGVGRSNAIVGDRGASPLVYDNEDFRVSAGLGLQRGPWTLDVMTGYSFHEGRDVSREEALLVPGHYDSGGGIVTFGLRRQH